MEFTMALAAAVVAGVCSVQSPPHKVALVELYTSEGCESCPPADKYLGELRASEKLIPLSLHVDYWNYLGWKDPFSRALFTERQRWLSDLARTHTIYTPELFVGGRELRGWPGGMSAAVERINAQPAQAAIAITVGAADSSGLPVEVRASAARAAKLHVALTEDGISSQVVAGENKGRLLHHDHVVRDWLVPTAVSGGGTVRVAQSLPIPRGANPDKLALVAFVQSAEGEILQATSLSVCKR